MICSRPFRRGGRLSLKSALPLFVVLLFLIIIPWALPATIIYNTPAANGTTGPPGPPGPVGPAGPQGNNLTFSSIVNNGDGTFTWYFSDGTNYTTGNLTGATGPQGPQGLNGSDGADGENGTSFDVGGPYLYNNGSNVIFFNDTPLQMFNNTVFAFQLNTTVNVSGGIGTATTAMLDGFSVKRITVTPSTSTNNYRFEATSSPSAIMIDRNRIIHNGTWDIQKDYASQEQIFFNITDATIDEAFTVSIHYLNNIGVTI